MVQISSRARSLYNRAHIQRLLGRPQRAAELCHEALQTADYSTAHLRAHHVLAELEFPGEDYFRVLARIHEHLKPATYLEIGIDQGRSFEIVRPETLALGIDPNPHLQKPLGPHQRVFSQTSDEFLEQCDVLSELGGRTLDLTFIDGMHQFEFALRDFIKSGKVLLYGLHDSDPRRVPDRCDEGRPRTGFMVLEWRYLALDSNIEEVPARSDGQRNRRTADGTRDRAKSRPKRPYPSPRSTRDH